MSEATEGARPALKILRTSTEKQETGLATQNNSIMGALGGLGVYAFQLPLSETTFQREYLEEKSPGEFADWYDGKASSVPSATVDKMHELNAFLDEGVSGGLDPFQRPGLSAALKFAVKNDIKTLVFYHNDRLSRNTEDALRTIRVLRSAGFEIIFLNVPSLRFETPEDYLLFTNLAMLATYFKDDLKRKTKAGMQRVKESGKWLGEPPYGFYCTTKIDDEIDYGTLLYNFQEIEILYLAMRHYINSTPPSYRGTASYLNAQGHTTRRGKQWSGQHIKNLLTKAVLRFDLTAEGKKRFAKWFPMVEEESGQ